MKKIFILSVILILTVCVLTSCAANDAQIPENDTSVFGSFKAEDLEGNTVTREIFAENKLTMVNIWGTFCGPCINEMPHLGALAKEYADKGVGIVGIVIDVADSRGNVDENILQDAVDIVALTNADYTHIVPSVEMFQKKLNSVFTYPETIFLDSQGNQVGERYIGARSKDDWALIIEQVLIEVQGGVNE